MLRHLLVAAILCGLAAVASRADVTLRYKVDFKPGAAMPPQAVEAMKKQQQLQLPMDQVTYLKGSKSYSKMMNLTAISDFDGALITVLDPGHKRYASVSPSEYMGALGKWTEIPQAARKALEGMQLDVTSRATGQANVIHGIAAEERELVVTMTMPTPGGPQTMRMVYRIWAPRPDAAANHPALRELALYTARAYAGTNPADLMQKMFTQMPGLGEGAKRITDEFKSMQAILGFRGAMYVPGMAAMMEQLRKEGKPVPPGLDPDAPMMEYSMDLEELSATPLADSLFQVPSDYTMAPLDEVLKSTMPATPARPKP